MGLIDDIFGSSSSKSSGTTVRNGSTLIHNGPGGNKITNGATSIQNGPGGADITNGAIHIDGSKVYDHSKLIAGGLLQNLQPVTIDNCLQNLQVNSVISHGFLQNLQPVTIDNCLQNL